MYFVYEACTKVCALLYWSRVTLTHYNAVMFEQQWKIDEKIEDSNFVILVVSSVKHSVVAMNFFARIISIASSSRSRNVVSRQLNCLFTETTACSITIYSI